MKIFIIKILYQVVEFHGKFIRIYPSTLYYLSLLSIVLYISSLGNVPNSMRCCLKMSKEDDCNFDMTVTKIDTIRA